MRESKRVAVITDIGQEVVDKQVNANISGQPYRFMVVSNDAILEEVDSKSGVIFGVCCYIERTILINEIHAETSSIEDIADTILHECAHALAVEYFNDYGHGKGFREVANMLGCNTTAKSSIALHDEFIKAEQKRKKYTMVYLDDVNKKVEVIRVVGRKMKHLSSRYLKRDPSSTKGKIYLVEHKKANPLKDSFNVVKQLAFQ